MSDERTQQGHGLVVEEAQPQTKRPPLYQVVTTYARQHQHPLLCTMEEA